MRRQRRYEVTAQCYVPVGAGGQLKHKKPGQLVTLTDSDAAKLTDYLKPLDTVKGVRNPDTPPKAKTESVVVPEPVAATPPVIVPATEPEEVSTDAGESSPAVQRAGAEADA